MIKHARDLNGLFLLDKPTGFSSNGALQAVKKLFQAKKAGHAGTLDPLASGMLVIGFGKTTKILSSLITADKTYVVTAKLGERTTTGDAEGEVVQSCEPRFFSHDEINTVLQTFKGETQQIPPMYSALKHQGKPLYVLARKGITIDREPRTVLIMNINLIEYNFPWLSLKVDCGKGTYIRTLVEDIGCALGVGAHVCALRRTRVGNFLENQMMSWEALKERSAEGDECLKSLLFSQ